MDKKSVFLSIILLFMILFIGLISADTCIVNTVPSGSEQDCINSGYDPDVCAGTFRTNVQANSTHFSYSSGDELKVVYSADLSSDTSTWQFCEAGCLYGEFEVGNPDYAGCMLISSNLNNWNFYDMPSIFESPKEFKFAGLALKPFSNGTFGWVQSPNHDLTAGNVYKIDFKVSSWTNIISGGDLYRPSQFRLRINDLQERENFFMSVNSYPKKDFYFYPSKIPKTYSVYFMPSNTGQYYFSFDVLQFDNRRSLTPALILRDLSIQDLGSLSGLGTESIIDSVDDFNSDDWKYYTMYPLFNKPDGTINADNDLVIQGTGQECNTDYASKTTFCDFGRNSGDYNYNNQPSVYSVIHILESDQTDPFKVPQIRIRANTIDEQIAFVYSVNAYSDIDGFLSPTINPREYYLLFSIPEADISLSSEDKQFYSSLDFVNFDDNKEASTTIKSASYQLSEYS